MTMRGVHGEVGVPSRSVRGLWRAAPPTGRCVGQRGAVRPHGHSAPGPKDSPLTHG